LPEHKFNVFENKQVLYFLSIIMNKEQEAKKLLEELLDEFPVDEARSLVRSARKEAQKSSLRDLLRRYLY